MGCTIEGRGVGQYGRENRQLTGMSVFVTPSDQNSARTHHLSLTPTTTGWNSGRVASSAQALEVPVTLDTDTSYTWKVGWDQGMTREIIMHGMTSLNCEITCDSATLHCQFEQMIFRKMWE